MRRFIVLLLALVLVSCNGVPVIRVEVQPTPTPTMIPTSVPCSVSANDWALKVGPLVGRFADRMELIAAAPSSLVDVISQLQDIKAETEAIEYPECAERAHSLLILAMDETIQGCLSFLSQEDDSVWSAYLDHAAQHSTEFNSEISNWR